ncbi:hypothetical protein [Rubinisphaera sp. JC750]|uniref:hypothetical protein n=1 Tax=Rubinisphaera sp. JC750 TaxID=2898658 RepID=UPI001F258084|nr:hypothetical protein [Rubinisphaera sp. JC750]
MLTDMNKARRHTLLRFNQAIPLLVMAILTGCSSEGEIPTYAVAGSVSLDGQPVSKARLAFMPDRANGNRGPQSFSFAHDGVFAVAEKQGLVEGAYLVDVTVMNAKGVPLGMASLPVSVAPDDSNYLYLELRSDDLQGVPDEEEEAEEDGEG